jgi:hypothetical protein
VVYTLDPLAIAIDADTWYHPLPVTAVAPLLNNAGENIVANLPSWYAAGITAGLAVLIFAKLTPLVVPAPVCVIRWFELEVAVSVLVLLSLNLNVNEPDTLNDVGVPLLNNPNPNNWVSTEDDTIVEPAATLVYVS